jgi:rubrerythrin
VTGFYAFGSVIVLLLTAIIWAAVRAGRDTGAALAPEERVDAAIEALRQLELEYQTGKLSDEEYGALRTRLEREALDARDARPSGFCPECGHSLEGDETFCPACGHHV